MEMENPGHYYNSCSASQHSKSEVLSDKLFKPEIVVLVRRSVSARVSPDVPEAVDPQLVAGEAPVKPVIGCSDQRNIPFEDPPPLVLSG